MAEEKDPELSLVMSSDDQEDGTQGASAMMSIFASYYGIEDNSFPEKSPAELIDSARFDADAYVREMLVSMPVEKLVAKDTSMIHEIRALDGDMQMLVYENYNKFIAATETIKRMKSNVEAMDDDMDTVRVKMDLIAKNASQLDESLADKRHRVNKLVRVRRLLRRLEFLSELPERLAEMISKEQYREAVQLYNKAITVLKNHSHVLSFKNIQERTEQMMRDLRHKVMDLLDDPQLEAVKLTQHVSVLRLMEAPREKVVEKLLGAHKRRSIKMIKQFSSDGRSTPTGHSDAKTRAGKDKKGHAASSPQGGSPMLGAGGRKQDLSLAASTSVRDGAGSVSYARKFHQSLIVGLIEACKGICELYQDIISLSSPTEAQAAEATDAYIRLQEMLSSVMGEYSKCIVDSIKTFYDKFGANLAAYQDLEKKSVTLKSRSASADEVDQSADQREKEKLADDQLTNNLRNAQLRMYEYDEERQAWMMLARQTILDCQYLDTEAKTCFPVSRGPMGSLPLSVGTGMMSPTKSPATEHARFSVAATISHADSYAAALLSVIDANNEVAFQRRVLSFVFSVVEKLPEFISFCDMKAETTTTAAAAAGSSASLSGGAARSEESLHHRGSESNMNVSTHSSSLHGSSHGRSGHRGGSMAGSSGSNDPMASRNSVVKRSSAAKAKFDHLIDQFIACFSDVCADYKPVVEVHCVANRSDAGEVSSLIVWRFVDFVCSTLEHTCGLTLLQKDDRWSSRRRGEFDDEIYVESIVYAGEGQGNVPVVALSSAGAAGTNSKAAGSPTAVGAIAVTPRNVSTGGSRFVLAVAEQLFLSEQHDKAETSLGVKSLFALVASTLVSRIRPVVIKRMNTELQTQEMDPILSNNNTPVLERCMTRMECCAQYLLKSFAERNATFRANQLTSALFGSAAHLRHAPGASSSDVHISLGVTEYALAMDALAVVCCILLAEVPPQIKVASLAVERDLNRRVTARQQGSRAGLQLDIERLFAQAVRIFDEEAFASPSLDVLVGTVLKASLKSAQEYSRLSTLSPLMYLQLQAELTFVKQLSASLMKDSTSCETLVDQVISSLFHRYSGANDLNASLADTLEVAVISKAISEALATVARQSVLLPHQ